MELDRREEDARLAEVVRRRARQQHAELAERAERESIEESEQNPYTYG